MYCITHKERAFRETMYLGWQNPVFLDDEGYFWTRKETVKKILCNNTSKHPFLFRSKAEAIKHLKSINIPQKCRVVKWR